jgi:hypothetical protein
MLVILGVVEHLTVRFLERETFGGRRIKPVTAMEWYEITSGDK